MNIDEIRSRIPALRHCAYLNMSYGPKPTPVVDEAVRVARFVEQYGTQTPKVMEEVERVYEGARADSARLLGAAKDEIALTRHVSEGINIVATGIDWQPGDEVIISDEEHPAGSLPWMNLARRRGIVVNKLRLAPYDTASLLDRLDQAITPRSKLLSLSHVSTRTGYVLPAREVSRLARERDVPILFDGAHAVGLIPVDVKDIGCDYYSGCGHKWLLAPQGTGFLYVDRPKLDDLEITWIGAGAVVTWNLERLEFEPLDTAAKFDFGTRDKTVYAALSTAVRMAEEIGVRNIAQRSWELSDRLRRRLSDVPGFRLSTPMGRIHSTGISAFDVIRLDVDDLVRRLWDEHRVLVTATHGRLRVSTPYFALEDEIDALADVLSALSATRP